MISKSFRTSYWLSMAFFVGMVCVMLSGCGGSGGAAPVTANVDPNIYEDKNVRANAKNNPAAKKGRIPMPPK